MSLNQGFFELERAAFWLPETLHSLVDPISDSDPKRRLSGWKLRGCSDLPRAFGLAVVADTPFEWLGAIGMSAQGFMMNAFIVDKWAIGRDSRSQNSSTAFFAPGKLIEP